MTTHRRINWLFFCYCAPTCPKEPGFRFPIIFRCAHWLQNSQPNWINYEYLPWYMNSFVLIARHSDDHCCANHTKYSTFDWMRTKNQRKNKTKLLCCIITSHAYKYVCVQKQQSNGWSRIKNKYSKIEWHEKKKLNNKQRLKLCMCVACVPYAWCLATIPHIVFAHTFRKLLAMTTNICPFNVSCA